MTLLQVLGLSVFPGRRYLSKSFAEIYRAQHGNAMLVHLCAQIGRPEKTVDTWNLLWPSRRPYYLY